jgi:hypothetical protein
MNPTRPHLLGLVAGLFLAGGLVASATLLTRTWLKVSDAESIGVTGAARRNVESDLILWRGTVTVEDSTLLGAQSTLKSHTEALGNFLRRHGLTNASLLPIVIQRTTSRIERGGESVTANTGFRLSRTAELRVPQIDAVLAMDADTGELVRQGIEFTTFSPEFIWTKAGEAKVEMLADAAADARRRAEQIASQGGRGISRLRSARMGVFQVTPLHSTITSGDGMNDTSSRSKTVTAIVHASFSLN